MLRVLIMCHFSKSCFKCACIYGDCWVKIFDGQMLVFVGLGMQTGCANFLIEERYKFSCKIR